MLIDPDYLEMVKKEELKSNLLLVFEWEDVHDDIGRHPEILSRRCRIKNYAMNYTKINSSSAVNSIRSECRGLNA